MAPPHTMKPKTPSPTTLIPGFEAMHITSNQPMKSLADELEEATKTKMDGDKSDTESIASCDSKEYDASAESDGATSFDEGNESMEYISPSKVIGKEEKQDSATAVEGPDGLKTPDRTFLPELGTSLQSLGETKRSPEKRSIKPLRTKSPRSTALVQYKPTPAQAKTTDLPFTTSDFSFGSTVASSKSSRSSSPAQSMAAALPSSTFEFSFGSPVSSPESSTPSSPFQATPTPAPSTTANKFDFSFGATVATMNFNVTAAAKIEESAQLSAPQDSNDDEKEGESAAAIATASLNFNTTGADNTVESPQMSTSQAIKDEKKDDSVTAMEASALNLNAPGADNVTEFPHMSTPQPTNDEKKGQSAVAIATTPLNFTTPGADNTMESPQLSTPQPITDEKKSEVTLVSNLSTLRPPSISKPPITAQLPPTLFNNNELSKDLPSGVEKKNSTPSTLATLTKTTQALETSIESIHSALYGVNPSSAISQPAKNAGLLLMNDCVAGWINESQLQHATINNRFTTFGNQMELMRQDLKELKFTHAKVIEQMAGEHTAALNEIKEMMKTQLKEVQELREREQASLATALRRKNDLMEELIKVKEAQKASDEENKVLRAENRALKETAVKAQEISQEQGESDSDEMSDDLMEVLWPQGWEEEEGARKRCAVDGKVLQRGVLANEPGFRVPAGNEGRGGGGRRGGGGWCTVM